MVVAAALLGEHGTILLQQRLPGRAMAGLWEFPGGKIEPHERPETALARELEEELGIFVSEESLVPAAFASADNHGRHMILLLFLCREWRGTPRPLDSSGLVWLRPDDMGSVDMPPADTPLVEALARIIEGGAPR
ncbi:MAG: (deoxy)nucleoside triphosphate pyrophosphohydrolase [Alphaproteobacteria bacterium]|nr:(deoxy)nucleoside triphosphate pyrophosphohydrolase [Alphaproteobacteria bacterium]